ncbi:MAG TPA: hypothetical protein VFX30_13365, partial [bacterium]|nr:hypothetical protein [bacterium]
DLITSITVLQHLTNEDDLKNVLRKFLGFLKPDGLFVILESAPSDSEEALNENYIRVRTRGDWLRLFEESGFSLESYRSYPQWGVTILGKLAKFRRRRHPAPQGANAASEPHRPSFVKKIIVKLVLLFSWTADYALRLPTPKSLATCGIMVLRRAGKDAS